MEIYFKRLIGSDAIGVWLFTRLAGGGARFVENVTIDMAAPITEGEMGPSKPSFVIDYAHAKDFPKQLIAALVEANLMPDPSMDLKKMIEVLLKRP